MSSTPAKVTQLREVLGVTAAVARGLLQQAGGDVEGAIAQHLAGVGPSGPQSPRSQLVDTLDGAVDRAQAQRLLARAGGSVEAAVDLFFTSGVPPPAAAAAAAAGGAAAAGAPLPALAPPPPQAPCCWPTAPGS